MLVRTVVVVTLALFVGFSFVAGTGSAMRDCIGTEDVTVVCLGDIECQYRSDCCGGVLGRNFWCPEDS